jgi:histidyl-tRNA synthetase
LLLTYFDEKGFAYALGLLREFRQAGIKTEIYPDQAKIKKQFEFASKKEIPFVGICGDQEISSGNISIKNLGTGEQNSYSLEQAIGLFI